MFPFSENSFQSNSFLYLRLRTIYHTLSTSSNISIYWYFKCFEKIWHRALLKNTTSSNLWPTFACVAVSPLLKVHPIVLFKLRLYYQRQVSLEMIIKGQLIELWLYNFTFFEGNISRSHLINASMHIFFFKSVPVHDSSGRDMLMPLVSVSFMTCTLVQCNEYSTYEIRFTRF